MESIFLHIYYLLQVSVSRAAHNWTSTGPAHYVPEEPSAMPLFATSTCVWLVLWGGPRRDRGLALRTTALSVSVRVWGYVYVRASERSLFVWTWWWKWKPFPVYRPFVRGIHRSSAGSPHKGQWRGALIFSLIWAWTKVWENSRDAGDSRRNRAYYDVTVMDLIGTGESPTCCSMKCMTLYIESTTPHPTDNEIPVRHLFNVLGSHPHVCFMRNNVSLIAYNIFKFHFIFFNETICISEKVPLFFSRVQ